MRRIVIALAATVSGLVMLFSWPTSTNQPVGLGVGAAGSGSGSSGGATDTASGPAGGSAASGSSTTYTGAAQRTQFGDVQVEITVADGQITDATAVSFPHRNGHDQQVNAYAIPILQDETVAAQGASIDLVSGATITSRAYVGSLQDALDQAGL